MAGRVLVGISKKGRVSSNKNIGEGGRVKGEGKKVWWSSKRDYSGRDNGIIRDATSLKVSR